jgi:glycosyltransferase involved in cell wall biosynthesis
MSETPIKLYEPIDTLKPVDDNIWIVDGPLVHMQMYGVRLPFSTRMTVIRLANGDLFLHSPTELVDSLKAEIDAIGRVRHLISPNKIHYTFIAQWGDAYPDAIRWASPGVRERAASQNIEVEFDRDLGDEPDPAWADEIDQVVFRGSRFMDEIEFFHKPSRTLILTDIIENFELERVSRKYAFLLRMAGNVDPDGKTPVDLRMTFWGHKDQAREAYARMLAWEPERIILAHGRWYPENGVEELKRAFRWLK